VTGRGVWILASYSRNIRDQGPVCQSSPRSRCTALPCDLQGGGGVEREVGCGSAKGCKLLLIRWQQRLRLSGRLGSRSRPLLCGRRVVMVDCERLQASADTAVTQAFHVSALLQSMLLSRNCFGRPRQLGILLYVNRGQRRCALLMLCCCCYKTA
jgi:hypothetical protein